jgi:hypothetical protein
MQDDREPDSPVAFGAEGIQQTGQDVTGQSPRLVEVVQPEEHGAGGPVLSPEDAFSLRPLVTSSRT